MKERRLRWYGHVMTPGIRIILGLTVQGRRARGIPKGGGQTWLREVDGTLIVARRVWNVATH